MATTPFAKKLVEVTQQQDAIYRNIDEAETTLCNQIKKYWTETGFTFTSCVSVAWWAVFVSWCIKKAGATSANFKFAQSHSKFVYKSISDALKNQGDFRGRKITEYIPKIGDILHNNRKGNSFTYDFASKNADYESHSAIIVEIGEDSKGKYALTIGGNEGDSIRVSNEKLIPTSA